MGIHTDSTLKNRVCFVKTRLSSRRKTRGGTPLQVVIRISPDPKTNVEALASRHRRGGNRQAPRVQERSKAVGSKKPRRTRESAKRPLQREQMNQQCGPQPASLSHIVSKYHNTRFRGVKANSPQLPDFGRKRASGVLPGGFWRLKVEGYAQTEMSVLLRLWPPTTSH